MSYQVLNAEIVEAALDLQEETGAAMVGFDVFDTLVTRYIPKEISFEMMCRALALEFLDDADRHDEIVSLYQEVYTASCRESVENGADYEAHTPDLMAGLAKGISEAGKTVPVEDLKAFLVRFECRLLRPMPGARPLLEALRDNDVDCVFVSDMFLGLDVVSDILDHFGLRTFFRAGYVSSDYRLLKRTGNLFPPVLKDLDLSAEQMVFVGDDFTADVEHPRALGMTAFQYVFPEIDEERTELRDLFTQAGDNRGALIRALTRAASGLDFENRSIEAFAANKYLGPYFASFAFAVHHQYSSLQSYGKVLFAAREGLFLQRLTDIFDATMKPGNPVEKMYFPASRLTAMAYSFAERDFTLGEMRLLLRNGRPHLRNVLSFLRLDEERLAEFAAEVGIKDADTEFHNDWLNWAPIHRIIEAVNRCPEFRDFKEKGRLFQLWMEQQGVFDGARKLFVDLGWSGQIQDAISRGFERRDLGVRLDGMYSGMRLEAHWHRRPGSDLLWYHCDETNDNILSKAPLWYPQILETICRSPHGTTVGFTEEDGVALPDFVEDRAAREEADDALISRMQELILGYTERLAYLMAIYAVTPQELRPHALHATFKFLTCPETDVARRFADFCNVSDMGSTEVFRYVGGMGIAGLDDDHFNAYEKTSLWRSGAAAAFFGETAAAAYSEQFIRRMGHHGGLVRRGGFTEFNMSKPLNDKVAVTEEVVSPDTAATRAWQARVAEIVTRVRTLAKAHEPGELVFSARAGEMLISPTVEAELQGMVARAVSEPKRQSWPMAPPHKVDLIFSDITALLRAKAGAETMARDRFETIRKMDTMIKNRDNAIKSQGDLLEERLNAIREMGGFIAERDQKIAALEAEIEALQANPAKPAARHKTAAKGGTKSAPAKKPAPKAD